MVKPHKHCELIKAWADGELIERFNDLQERWLIDYDPTWLTENKYRLHDPYRELKEAYAAGKVIEVHFPNLSVCGEDVWSADTNPDWSLPPERYHIKPETKVQLSASEALYGFCGWITTRDKEVTASAHHDSGVWADLIKEFIEANNLDEPREQWQDDLIHPVSKPEPKTVKMWQWFKKDINKAEPYLTRSFYDDHYLDIVPADSVEWIRKAEWTEIEVEVSDG